MPMGNPQWPLLAFWTASMVSTRIALIQVWSRSDRFTLICDAVAKISPRLVEGGHRIRRVDLFMFSEWIFHPIHVWDKRNLVSERAPSPIFLVVVLGIAGLATHHIHAGFRITFMTGAECFGKSLRDHPHHTALFRIERAAERGKLPHRKTNCGDRSCHIATLTACNGVAQTLAHAGNRRPGSLTDHDLEFAKILREFRERIVCGIAERHSRIVSSVQV